MSRRRASRAIEEAQAIEESLPPGWDSIDVVPASWRDEWAETTARVIRIVWSKQGSRLYATHRDALLREDLQSWLATKAVEISLRYFPDPVPDAESRWAGYLHQALTGEAIHHFGDVVGRSERSKGRAAIEAHQRGIGSLEKLAEMEAESGYVAARHPLAAEDLLTRNPEVVHIALDDLEARTINVSKVLMSETHRARGTWCIEAGCPRLAEIQGRCKAHYQRDRELWAEEDGRPACAIPDCDRPAVARGLCHTHHRHLLRGVLPEELHQHVQPLRSEVNAHGCTHEGCEKPAKNRGLCATHWRATRPPCSVPDCGKPTEARGLCQAHYARLRKGTLGDLMVYAKEPGQ